MSAEHTQTRVVGAVDRLRARAYTLEVIEGPDRGLSLQTRQRVVRLGVHPDCDLVLNDGTTSRQHARIELDVRGHRLIDEGSKNGTFLNGLQVIEAYLPESAQLRIGANLISFTLGEEAVEIDLAQSHRFGRLIGGSALMREIFALLQRAAPTEITVLVEGESGTGKELAAEALHQHSRRAQGPFVVFDCSAVAANLVESELFGHTKGAFTGAIAQRVGAFERAHGGTLFLDEVGELPLDLQPKLLRALEQREVRPVGADRPIKVDVRIIAATNRDLSHEVEAGHFRTDLYYRLAVMRICLPSLRRRVEDIPELVQHFLEEFSPPEQPRIQVAYDTIIKLQRHHWPGNVRELRNFVERAAMLATDNRIETRYLSSEALGGRRPVAEQGEVQAPGGAEEAPLPSEAALEQLRARAALVPEELDLDLAFKDAKARLVDHFERVYWERLLAQTEGNVSAAARIAGIHRKSAEYLLKKLDLRGQGQ